MSAVWSLMVHDSLTPQASTHELQAGDTEHCNREPSSGGRRRPAMRIIDWRPRPARTASGSLEDGSVLGEQHRGR